MTVKIKNIFTVILIICFFGTTEPIFAATSDASGIIAAASYDVENRYLEVRGMIHGDGQRLVLIEIMPAAAAAAGVTVQDINNQSVIVDMLRVDADNEFSKVIVLPDTFESGAYKIRAYYEGQCVESSFINISEIEEAKRVLERLNGASAAEFNRILLENIEVFGLDGEDDLANRDAVNDRLFKNRPHTGYALETFLNQYFAVLTISKVSSGNEGLDRMLQQYGAYLNISYFYDYTIYSDEIKKEIAGLMNGEEYSGDFSDYYKKLLLLARIRNCASFEKLQELTVENATMLTIDIDAYKKLSSYNKDNVFRTLFRNLDDTTLKAFADRFNEEVQNLGYDDGRTASSSTGGGGAGGGTNSNAIAIFDISQVQNGPEEQSNGTVTFPDVEKHWAETAINNLVEKQIINGENGMFYPERNISRAEFAKIISCWMNLPLEYNDRFYDVQADQWYGKYIGAAAAAGLIEGYENYFRPEAAITREDAAVIIFRALRDSWEIYKPETEFSDMADVSEYAAEGVKVLAANKIISGYNGDFQPKNSITRAEAVMMIYNAVLYLNQ